MSWGEKFVKPGTWITDIGCSTGLAVRTVLIIVIWMETLTT